MFGSWGLVLRARTQNPKPRGIHSRRPPIPSSPPMFPMPFPPARGRHEGLDVVHDQKGDEHKRDDSDHDHENGWPKIIAQAFPKNL